MNRFTNVEWTDRAVQDLFAHDRREWQDFLAATLIRVFKGLTNVSELCSNLIADFWPTFFSLNFSCLYDSLTTTLFV